jgi:hypothetical protein
MQNGLRNLVADKRSRSDSEGPANSRPEAIDKSVWGRTMAKAKGGGLWSGLRVLTSYELKKYIGMKHMGSVNGKSKSNSARSKPGRGSGYVLCIDNRGYLASLEVGKVYRVPRGDAGIPNWIRVVDESGEDYLYPSKRFVPMVVPPRARRALEAAYR